MKANLLEGKNMQLFLKSILQMAGISQKLFSEMVEIHETRLSQLINLRAKPTNFEIVKICEKLDVSEENCFAVGSWSEFHKNWDYKRFEKLKKINHEKCTKRRKLNHGD